MKHVIIPKQNPYLIIVSKMLLQHSFGFWIAPKYKYSLAAVTE